MKVHRYHRAGAPRVVPFEDTRIVDGRRLRPLHGLCFGIALGVLAAVELTLTANVLSAALAMAGLLGYVFVYTLWLKPPTPQNIVIGGAAGAVPPLVGWAAATGGLSPTPCSRSRSSSCGRRRTSGRSRF